MTVLAIYLVYSGRPAFPRLGHRQCHLWLFRRTSSTEACARIRRTAEASGVRVGFLCGPPATILLRLLPETERWRVDIVFVCLAISVYGLLAERNAQREKNGWRSFFFGIYPFLAFWLLYGGSDLPVVETRLWGGLMLTLTLSGIGIVFSLPIGILLALGDARPCRSCICSRWSFIEFARGVPLITILFMANDAAAVPAARVGSTSCCGSARRHLFAAAYMAEVVRGGLPGLPKGQYEGAMAMGLGYSADDAPDRPAPGVADRHSRHRQQFHQPDPGHDAGRDCRSLRLPQHRSRGRTRSQLARHRNRRLRLRAVVYWVFCFAMSRYSMFSRRKLHTGP